MSKFLVTAIERIQVYQIIEANTPEEAKDKAHDEGDWMGDEYINMEDETTVRPCNDQGVLTPTTSPNCPQ